MTPFRTISLKRSSAKKDLNDFRDLLNSKPALREIDDILPFFRSHEHLSALMGTYNPNIIDYKNIKIAFEFDIFGDHIADLAVGDSKNNQYCFIEFEDASETSIFKKKPKATPEWSPRFEHGFSQLIDWILWIENHRGTPAFSSRFNASSIQFVVLLVIGRAGHLATQGLCDRMIWRSEQVVVASRKVNCITFDKLYDDLATRLEVFKG
jgi:Domain of unknown function (DUF4263)